MQRYSRNFEITGASGDPQVQYQRWLNYHQGARHRQPMIAFGNNRPYDFGQSRALHQTIPDHTSIRQPHLPTYVLDSPPTELREALQGSNTAMTALDSWRCPRCTTRNLIRYGKCLACPYPDPGDVGEWCCPGEGCTIANNKARGNCWSCGALRMQYHGPYGTRFSYSRDPQTVLNTKIQPKPTWANKVNSIGGRMEITTATNMTELAPHLSEAEEAQISRWRRAWDPQIKSIGSPSVSEIKSIGSPSASEIEFIGSPSASVSDETESKPRMAMRGSSSYDDEFPSL